MRNPAASCLSVFLAACLAAQSVRGETAPSVPAQGAADPVLDAPPTAAPGGSGPAPDTVYVRVPVRGDGTDRHSEYDLAFLTGKRDHFARMQERGFALMMTSIATGVGGIALMVTGINQNIDAQRELDRRNQNSYYYEDQTANDGMGIFFLGYLSVLATPGFLITGIVLNRVGNGRRLRYEEMIAGHRTGFRLDAGMNSLRLSYSF